MFLVAHLNCLLNNKTVTVQLIIRVDRDFVKLHIENVYA